MDREERVQVRKCLFQPAQERFDVPINGGAIVVPMEFIKLTGHVVSTQEERILVSGSLQIRVIKQISRFGDIRLFDYYESEIYDRDKIENFGLPRKDFSQQMSHNIKISHNGDTSHFTGACRHAEIIDVRHCNKRYFFIQTKSCYNEINWVRL
ncbi:MAG: hypothetical protein ACKUBY_02180 [Candidatus Moraniibacteriota bacterium]|jgi:hypothetical protein